MYHYDALDNRLQIETKGQIRYFIYDSGNNLLAEADEHKQIVRYYIHGGGLTSMIQDDKVYTYHFSATGHTLAITDENQQVVNGYAYDPYGRIIGESQTAGLEQPFKYVGRYGVQHEEGALYYMRARYYDAEIGRFIKEDPIGLAGGINLYMYVGGNPVAFVDPSGLIGESSDPDGSYGPIKPSGVIYAGAGGSKTGKNGAGANIERGFYYDYDSGQGGCYVCGGGRMGSENGGYVEGGYVTAGNFWGRSVIIQGSILGRGIQGRFAENGEFTGISASLSGKKPEISYGPEYTREVGCDSIF